MIFGLMKLFSGGVAPSPSRREIAMPDEIDQKIAELPPVPRKFREDIAILENLYGDKFTTGLCIELTLQEALKILARDRQRVDSYTALSKYLLSERGIQLTIRSNKTR